MGNTTRWSTGRTEAFSDGVFAIAITLLVLELSVPEAKFENLWQGIADQWPSYLGYVTSFLTIGGIWLAHHGIFSRLAFVNRRLMQLNILLLMAVSFLPFPTRLVAEAIDTADAERAAVIFYGLVLLAISLISTAMWRAIADEPELLEPSVSQTEVAMLARSSAPSLGFYAVVIVVALVAPQLAAFGYLAIADRCCAHGTRRRSRRRPGDQSRGGGVVAARAWTPRTGDARARRACRDGAAGTRARRGGIRRRGVDRARTTNGRWSRRWPRSPRTTPRCRSRSSGLCCSHDTDGPPMPSVQRYRVVLAERDVRLELRRRG